MAAKTTTKATATTTKRTRKATPEAKAKAPAKRTRKTAPPATPPKADRTKPTTKGEQSMAAAGQFWRIATTNNPKSGRPITLELRKDGGLVPSDQTRTGIEHVGEWHEVRATTRVEALKKIAAGEAELRTR